MICSEKVLKNLFKKHVVPYHDQWDKKGIVSRDFWLEAGAAGILCPDVPSKYGGADGDFRHNIIVIEELMKVGATGPGVSVHSDIVIPYIMNYGTEEQKKLVAWYVRRKINWCNSNDRARNGKRSSIR